MSLTLIAAIVIALIGGAFLAGYLPERQLRIAAEEEARALRTRLEAEEARVRMAQLLGQAFAMREVVLRRNYGQAQGMSSTFFDSVRSEAAGTPSGEFRTALNDVLARRDAVTASLAKADPGILDALQAIEVRMRRALSYPVPEEASPK